MRTILKNNTELKDTHDVETWNKIAEIVNNTEKQPTIVNPDSKFVVITYWWGRGNINKNTRKPCYDDDASDEKQPIKYEEMIEIWENTCRQSNCNYLAIEYPEFAQKGGYQLAINAKPLFIKKALELCGGRGVVYIDGDMTVNQYPHIFDMDGYDFMARHWNIDPRSTPIYKESQCIDMTIFETSGGIMYFNYTVGSFGLLDKWIYHTFYKTNTGKADDRILSLIFGNKQYTYNLRIFYLPIEYLWLTDFYQRHLNRDDSTIIIEHPACLTTEEMAQDLGAAKNREPKLYSKIVTDYLECSKFGGFFWEYVFFENEKQVESFGAFLAYMKQLIIEDAYEDKNSDDLMKPPYYFVDYKDRYGKFKFDGEKYQDIADKNAKYVSVISELLRTKKFMSPKKIVYVSYKDSDNSKKSPSSPSDPSNMCSMRMKSTIFIDINSDPDSNKVVYTNRVNCTIIALLNMGYEVIYVPNVESIIHVDRIMLEKSKNPDLELIFCNRFGYTLDSIRIFDDTPIYFKKGRILMHLLNLVTSKAEFKVTFERIFKSSLLFVHTIRTGLFKKATAKESVIINAKSFPIKSMPKSAPTPVLSATYDKPGSKTNLNTRKAKSAPTVPGLNDDTPILKGSPKTLLKTTFNKIRLSRMRGQHEKDRDRILDAKKAMENLQIKE
jgi:hypothetical protein